MERGVVAAGVGWKEDILGFKSERRYLKRNVAFGKGEKVGSNIFSAECLARQLYFKCHQNIYSVYTI
jgi:hypothetical protein